MVADGAASARQNPWELSSRCGSLGKEKGRESEARLTSVIDHFDFMKDLKGPSEGDPQSTDVDGSETDLNSSILSNMSTLSQIAPDDPQTVLSSLKRL